MGWLDLIPLPSPHQGDVLFTRLEFPLLKQQEVVRLSGLICEFSGSKGTGLKNPLCLGLPSVGHVPISQRFSTIF
jgi:hypothetical protein